MTCIAPTYSHECNFGIICSRQGLETVQQSVLADIYNYCHRNKQEARESISRESSTSEDGDSLVGHESSEKDSDEDRVGSPSESFEDFSRNGKIMSTLQSLAAREESKSEVKMEDLKISVDGCSKPSGKDQKRSSVLSKKRFKITKIMESRGHSTAGLVKKITNVWNDSSINLGNKEGSTASGGVSRDTSVEGNRKETLKRQPNVESPTPADAEHLSSPVRSRNAELKEFYRRLKDGEINSADFIIADKSKAANDRKVDNHIEKLPFPGKAQKLNDVIKDNLSTTEHSIGTESGQSDSIVSSSYSHSQHEIGNTTVGIE